LEKRAAVNAERSRAARGAAVTFKQLCETRGAHTLASCQSTPLERVRKCHTANAKKSLSSGGGASSRRRRQGRRPQ